MPKTASARNDSVHHQFIIFGFPFLRVQHAANSVQIHPTGMDARRYAVQNLSGFVLRKRRRFRAQHGRNHNQQVKPTKKHKKKSVWSLCVSKWLRVWWVFEWNVCTQRGFTARKKLPRLLALMLILTFPPKKSSDGIKMRKFYRIANKHSQLTHQKVSKVFKILSYQLCKQKNLAMGLDQIIRTLI